MIKSILRHSTPLEHSSPPICFPFLWRDEKGTIWLRNGPAIGNGTRDICVGNGLSFVVGDITPIRTSDKSAWDHRVTSLFTLELSNQ